MTDTNDEGSWDVPELEHAELVQMRIRLIALETIVAALLSTASDEQRQIVAAYADNIRARPDAKRHPLTEYAAEEIERLLNRSDSA
ncbi:hypothetical protein [Sphingomicrobium lutaoense]|uniref:Uncharacterized protein n=1 Tax=Sphingomicrobium lutaoense TaxID=515949 RepID=A0A839Z7S0_9SPHN|nr:hypothetical protein [Sphingomicrobium lutaoense]MBB3764934.1 hypothetical protein [Sphingomicrobium lutaoense]